MNNRHIFKLKRVLCERNFLLRDVELGIPVVNPSKKGLDPLPVGSRLNEQKTKTTATVTSCTIEEILPRALRIRIEVFIEKQIVVNRPGREPLEMKFSFTRVFRRLLPNCHLSNLRPADLHHLQCQIWRLNLADKIKLNPIDKTFDDFLTIKGIVKIDLEEQVPLKVGPVLPITIPPELGEAIGKIRQVVFTGPFKSDLLNRLNQVRNLLRSGLLVEALVTVSTVIEKVLARMKTSTQPNLLLVLHDLLNLKQALQDLL